MKKTAFIFSCLLFMLALSSCFYELEDGPFFNEPAYNGPLYGPGQSCFLSDWDGYNHVSIIKVWRDPDFQHRHFREAKPNTQVKVLEINGNTAHVLFPDGVNGWIRSIHIKKENTNGSDGGQ